MSNPNFDSRYAKTTDVATAIAAQAATDAGQYIPLNAKSSANGIATLNSIGQLNNSQLPTALVSGSATGPISGTSSNTFALRDNFSVKDVMYGALGTALKANDAIISSTIGGAVVTTSLASTAVVGFYAQIASAGPSGGPLTSRIVAVGSNTITLITAATATVNAAAITVGPDDRPAFQAAQVAAEAITAATGRGVTVYIPAGNYFFGTGSTVSGNGVTYPTRYPAGIPISRSLTSKITWQGAGRGSAVITLSSGCMCFAYPNKIADYDTFQNITMQDFDIDCNGVYDAQYGLANHVLFGNMPSNSTAMPRLNFNNLTFRRLGGLNLPSIGTVSNANQSFILIVPNQTTTGESTQTNVTNIRAEDIEVTGGGSCITVACYNTNTPGQNVYFNNISYYRCRHSQTSYPTAQGAQTSFYICGSGFGNKCEIVDCYSQAIADDGIEVGAMQQVLIDNFTCIDPYMYGITFRHTHQPTDVSSQRVVVRDSRIITTTTGSAMLANSSNAQRGYSSWIADGSNTFGEFIFERPLFESNGDSFTTTNNQYPFIYCQSQLTRLQIQSARIRLNGYTMNPTTSKLLAPLAIIPPSGELKLVIRDYHLQVDAMTLSGSGTSFFPLYMTTSGTSTLNFTVDGMTSSIPALTFGGGGTMAYISLGGGNLTRGSIRNVRLSGNGISGASLYGIQISNSSSSNSSSIEIENCDVSQVGFLSPGRDYNVTNTNTQARTRIKNNIWFNVPTPASITPSGSVYTYQNLDGYDELVTVSGGTVTAISTSDAAGNNIATGLTQGVFMLQTGWKIVVTYSSAPTMTKTPQW